MDQPRQDSQQLRIYAVSYTHLDVYKRQIQSYFSGLILSTIAQKSKQDFEYKLVQTEDKLKKFKSENSDKKVKGGEL